MIPRNYLVNLICRSAHKNDKHIEKIKIVSENVKGSRFTEKKRKKARKPIKQKYTQAFVKGKLKLLFKNTI